MLFRVFMPRISFVAKRNIDLVFPEKSEAERERIFRDSWGVLAENLYWFCRISRWTKQDFIDRIEYSTARAFRDSVQARNLDTGILVFAIHFGLFELLAQGDAVLGRPTSILIREFDFPLLNAFWKSRREAFGAEVFSRKGGFEEILKRLRVGKDVALLVDQNVKRKHGMFVPLFGIQASTSRGIGLAALRSRAPVVFAVCYPIEKNRFRLYAEEIPGPSNESGTSAEKIEKFLIRVNGLIEKMVREHPEQWFWIHRRFKTRPDGEAEDVYDRNISPDEILRRLARSNSASSVSNVKG